MRPVKRKRVDSANYFRSLMVYIHTNPVAHGFDYDLENYPWSSSREFIEKYKPEKKSLLFKSKYFLQKYFDDLENFRFAHNQRHGFKNIFDFTIED